jgi:ribosomal-protein-alanine N-acetyltransferase
MLSKQKKYNYIKIGSLFLIGIIALGLGAYFWKNLSEKSPVYEFPLATEIPDQYLDISKMNSVLKGEKITLKILKEDYIEQYHDVFSADVRRGLSFSAAVDDENYTINYVSWHLDRQAKGEMIEYVIFDNGDNKLIGSIDIRGIHQNDPGQLGCWINDNYRGGGRMQEGLKLITEEYFRVTGAPLVSALIEPFNIASYKALTKFGFKQRTSFKTYKRIYNTFEYANPHYKEE